MSNLSLVQAKIKRATSVQIAGLSPQFKTLFDTALVNAATARKPYMSYDCTAVTPANARYILAVLLEIDPIDGENVAPLVEAKTADTKLNRKFGWDNYEKKKKDIEAGRWFFTFNNRIGIARTGRLLSMHHTLSAIADGDETIALDFAFGRDEDEYKGTDLNKSRRPHDKIRDDGFNNERDRQAITRIMMRIEDHNPSPTVMEVVEMQAEYAGPDMDEAIAVSQRMNTHLDGLGRTPVAGAYLWLARHASPKQRALLGEFFKDLHEAGKLHGLRQELHHWLNDRNRKTTVEAENGKFTEGGLKAPKLSSFGTYVEADSIGAVIVNAFSAWCTNRNAKTLTLRHKFVNKEGRSIVWTL